MERRILSGTRQIAGATLTISTMDGYSALVNGDYIGFMHIVQGGAFNAYQRVPGKPDRWLGSCVEVDAVRAILEACGREPAAVT